MTQYVYGKNVVKQLLVDHKKIYEVLMVEGMKDKELQHIVASKHIPCKRLDKKKMDHLLQANNHQGIAALIDDYKTYEIADIIESIPRKKTPLLLMLDNLEDPHNLGAILRTCDCVGVDGVIIGKHHSVKLTPTVAKISTGAIESVKVSIVNNLVQTMVYLKKQGYWIVGADMEHSRDYREGQYDVPLVMVIGSEGSGMRALVKKNCDYTVHLPMEGVVTSLNASVATAILLYQIYAYRHPLN